MTGPGRDPYAWVKTALRQEVGFCCPVRDCGSPYLTWHHFDPPWRVEHHHRPEGMIALCREHADQADNGAFTDDQIREMKREGKSRAVAVRGTFNWMRQDLLAVVGGNFYYQLEVIFQIGDHPCIWFDRDEDGYLLLSFKMPTMSGTPRAQIDQNFWSVSPAVHEVVCPPSGRLIQVEYPGGDKFRAEFFTAGSGDDIEKRYPQVGRPSDPSPPKPRDWYSSVQFPLTVVELWETAAGTNIEFGPKFSKLPGAIFIDCFMRGGGAAIGLNLPPEEIAQLFPSS